MSINNEQRTRVTVSPKTAGGRDARIDGAVTFGSSDSAVARIEAIDATSAYAYGVAPGTAVISASFDADLDEGEVRTLVFDGELVVTEAEAVSAGVAFSDGELVLTPAGEPAEETPPVEEVPADEPPADEPPADEEAPVDEPTPADPEAPAADEENPTP